MIRLPAIPLLTRPLAALLILAFCSHSSAFALDGASSPRALLNGLINSAKKGNPVIALEQYLHWPSLYKNLSNEDRGMIGISSSDGLKKNFLALMTDPEKQLKKMLSSKIKTLAPEQQLMMQGVVDQTAKLAAVEVKRHLDKAKRAEVTVDDLTETATTAQAKVTVNVDGETTQAPIDMSKIDGRWFINASNFDSKIAPGLPFGG